MAVCNLLSLLHVIAVLILSVPIIGSSNTKLLAGSKISVRSVQIRNRKLCTIRLLSVYNNMIRYSDRFGLKINDACALFTFNSSLSRLLDPNMASKLSLNFWSRILALEVRRVSK